MRAFFRTRSEPGDSQRSQRRSKLSQLLSSDRPLPDLLNASSTSSATVPEAAPSSSIPKAMPSTGSSALPPSPPSSDLPAMPSDNDSFLQMPMREPSSQIDNDNGDIDEGDMARKLMDLESSFVADSLLSNQSKAEVPMDDSLAFGRPLQPHASSSPTRQPRNHDKSLQSLLDVSTYEPDDNDKSFQSTISTEDVYQTPATRPHPTTRPANFPDEDELDYDDDSFRHSGMLHTLSSPVAAAAQRSKLRAACQGNPVREPSLTFNSASVSSAFLRQPELEDDATPKQSRHIESQVLVTGLSSLRVSEESSQEMIHQPTGLGSFVPDFSDLSSHEQRRSGYLSNRRSSQRISASSLSSKDVRSQTTLGANYGLQSGSIVSEHEYKHDSAEDLSRLPSFGSVASSISAQFEHHVQPGEGHETPQAVALSDEAEGQTQRTPSALATPRVQGGNSILPTDTVLAQHVKNVKVPNTVVREYRASRFPGSAMKDSAMSTPYYGHGKNNLTLKEQNSRIDKLSKENFDLKLKIHFLSQALQDRSDEGVQDIVSKNAQLQADLVKAKKDSQSLRRKLKDLDRQNKERAGDLLIVQNSIEGSEDDGSSRSFLQAQMEEEILYLRDQVRYLEQKNKEMANDKVSHAFEAQKLADHVRILGDCNQAKVDQRLTAWKDLIDQEKASRQQAEREIQTLQAELVKSRRDQAPVQQSGMRIGFDHFSNKDSSRGAQSRNNTSMSGSTAVEQLKQENAELRRDLGAQTSMLTSRNRERERLQQQIEDLKLFQRRGESARSAAGDSILDRSVSRANNRRAGSPSVTSSHASPANDMLHDQREGMNANLRDENAGLRLRNQELQRDFNDLNDRAEALQANLEEAVRELESADNRLLEDKDYYENELLGCEDLLQQKEQEIQQLIADINNKDEDISAREQEIKNLTKEFHAMLDESEASIEVKRSLEQELVKAREEHDTLEKRLRDATAAKERLEVQAESSQNEISFLREEQEGDKIKIGDLQSALRNAKTTIRDERERLKELDELDEQARKDREEVRRLKKTLEQRDLELSAAKEKLEELYGGLREGFGNFDGTRSSLLADVVKLQRDLDRSLRDLEAAKIAQSEKERLLRDREGLLEASGLEARRVADLLDKERQGRKHDLNEFERERARRSPARDARPDPRRIDLENARNQDKKRISGLEQQQNQLQKRYEELEQQHQTQLDDRNTLLLSLWTHVSALCGAQWAEQHNLHLDQATLTEDLPSVDRTINLALQTLENTVTGFRTRLRKTEKDIWTDFQTLERVLDARCKRLEMLEDAVQRAAAETTQPQSDQLSEELKQQAERREEELPNKVARLKEENKLLRSELKIVKQGFFALPGLPSPQHDTFEDDDDDYDEPRPPPHHGIHPSRAGDDPRLSRKHSITSTASRGVDAHSTNLATVAGAPAVNGSVHAGPSINALGSNGAPVSATLAASERRWILRLQELERRLKVEREARLLDRSGARKRLEEGMAENERLRGELIRERERSRGNSDAGRLVLVD